MNIMNLIPQSEYEKLKNLKEKKIFSNTESKKNNIQNYDSTNKNKDNSYNINQLNQTKVEDGGKQTIINTCGKQDLTQSDIDSQIEFPKNETFNSIDGIDNNSYNDSLIDYNYDEKKEENINELDTPPNNSKSQEDSFINTNAYNEKEQIDSPAITIASDEDDGQIEPEQPINKQSEDLSIDNLDKTPDNFDIQITDGNLTSPLESKKTSIDDVDKLITSLSKPEVDKNAREDDTEESQLPSPTSVNPDDKYKLWKSRTKFASDPNLWELNKNSIPKEDKSKNIGNSNVSFKVPSRTKQLSNERKKPYIKRQTNKKPLPIDTSGKSVTNYNNPINPDLAITTENSTNYKNKSRMQKKRQTPYSKSKTASAGGFKKNNILVATTSKSNKNIPIETITIESSDQESENKVNKNTTSEVNVIEPGKDMVKKGASNNLKTQQKSESDVNTSTIKQDKKVEMDIPKKQVSRKRTDEDWLAPKDQTRPILKNKIRTRAKTSRDNARENYIAKKRNIVVRSIADEDIPQIANIVKKRLPPQSDTDDNRIIEDLLDPKRPKLASKNSRLKNYAIWNQIRK